MVPGFQGGRGTGSVSPGLPGFCDPQLFSAQAVGLVTWGWCFSSLVDMASQQLAQAEESLSPLLYSIRLTAVQLQRRVVSLSTGSKDTQKPRSWKKPNSTAASLGPLRLVSCVFKQVHFIQIVKLTASCLFIPLSYYSVVSVGAIVMQPFNPTPLFLTNVYWRIVTLQCCVSFCYSAEWINHTNTYTPSFLDFLPIQVTTEHWVESPVLCSRFSLVIYFIHSIKMQGFPCGSAGKESASNAGDLGSIPGLEIHIYVYMYIYMCIYTYLLYT